MLILYDRDCGFCAWTVAWLLRWDRRGALRAATIQGPEGAARLAHLDPDARLASWHIAGPDGRIRSGGAGLAPVLAALPGGRPLAALAARTPHATARAYDWVATAPCPAATSWATARSRRRGSGSARACAASPRCSASC
jgi:predicted DCC family thiol-disulfide oxidoreductase YuxK